MIKHLFLIAAVPLLLLSCQKRGAGSPTMGETSVLVTTGVAAKTTLGEESAGAYPIYWQQGDRISVNGQLSDALVLADPVTEAEFRLAGLHTSAPYNYLYPGNTSSQVTLDGAAMPMYARSNSLVSVSLSHLTCGVRLDLSGDADIVSVCLSAPGGEYPGGTFSVDFTGGTLSPVSGLTIVTKNVSVTLPQTFYVFFTPGTYSQGLNLTVSAGSVSNSWHFATGVALVPGKIYSLPDAVFRTGDLTCFLPNSTIEDVEVVSLDM